MKIAAINTINLRNNEHFQFHTEFRDLILKYGAKKLKIAAQFEAYLPLYEKEDEGIKKINKSAITAEIYAADKARDDVWRGLVLINTAMYRHHFDPVARETARRLKIVFDTYGKAEQMPLNEQTSATYNILQELQGQYAADVETVGLTHWVAELQTRNETFEKLIKDRVSEAAIKSDVVLKEARALLDEAYRAMTTRINALVEVEGQAEYEPFIRELNIFIEKYTTTMAQHHKKKAINNEQGTMNDDGRNPVKPRHR